MCKKTMNKSIVVQGTLVLRFSNSSTDLAAELHRADIKKDIPSSAIETIDFVDGENDSTTINRKIEHPTELKSVLITF
jgi:hypothetical protein